MPTPPPPIDPPLSGVLEPDLYALVGTGRFTLDQLLLMQVIRLLWPLLSR